MKLDDLANGLKDGSIKILGNHRTNPLADRIDRDIKRNADMFEKYKDKKDRASMLSMIKENGEIRFGNYIGMGTEMYCFDCGKNMYVIPLDEKTVAYCDPTEYWELADRSGTKYDFVLKHEHVKDCAAVSLRSQKKIVSEIELETGALVFCNHFGEKPILDSPEKEEYHDEWNLNSVLGRNNITQYLAKQNVGYGQMGNMSVTVYSNPEDEILIAEHDPEDRIEDLTAALAGEYGKNTEERTKEMTEDLAKYKEFEELIKSGKYERRGEVNCRVWRWMCADDAHVKRVKAKPSNEGEKAVRFKVKPGRYVIEHYYDFQDGPIYSKMKPKNNKI